MTVFPCFQTSYRGRKALNLGGVVSPRAKQSKASNSPAPAAVPQQSPNTTAGVNHQQANLQITAQQPQQSDTQLANIQQIPSTIAQTMKEQTPMVSFVFGENYFLGDFSIQ
jgi:hypothetical protein